MVTQAEDYERDGGSGVMKGGSAQKVQRQQKIEYVQHRPNWPLDLSR